MNIRRKKPRPLSRQDVEFRDARLFIVATEDTHAPSMYLRLFRNTRIKVLVLSTTDGLSAPGHVKERLDKFHAEYDLMDDDELWLVLDVDHWADADHVQTFRDVCSEALRKGYQLAHSNPCFELWLLLHLIDLDESRDLPSCADVKALLKQQLGGYGKNRISQENFPPETIKSALRRAECLDRKPDDRWPQCTGTHVYRLVKKLV